VPESWLCPASPKCEGGANCAGNQEKENGVASRVGDLPKEKLGKTDGVKILIPKKTTSEKQTRSPSRSYRSKRKPGTREATQSRSSKRGRMG